MNYKKLRTAGILLAAMMTTSVYAYNEASAKYDCINVVTRGGQYHKTSNKHVVNKGHQSYGVTGNVKSRHDNSTHKFSCNIRHGQVVNWHVSRRSTRGSKNNSAAVGAGILAIAAIAAAVNGNNKRATHRNKNRYNNYDSGGSAFDDMRYLKQQCRQNLRHHIDRAHGRVSKLKLDTAHLHRQSLNGRGFVIFERGDERDLDYNCEFDRRGHIRDGHYQFGRY